MCLRDLEWHQDPSWKMQTRQMCEILLQQLVSLTHTPGNRGGIFWHDMEVLFHFKTLKWHGTWAIFFSLSSSWYRNVFCLGLSILFNKPLQCWHWSRLSGDSPCEPIFSSKLYCWSWNFVLHFVVPIVCIAPSRFEAPFQGADYVFQDWCSLPRFPHFLGLFR